MRCSHASIWQFSVEHLRVGRNTSVKRLYIKSSFPRASYDPLKILSGMVAQMQCVVLALDSQCASEIECICVGLFSRSCV